MRLTLSSGRDGVATGEMGEEQLWGEWIPWAGCYSVSSEDAERDSDRFGETGLEIYIRRSCQGGLSWYVKPGGDSRGVNTRREES